MKKPTPSTGTQRLFSQERVTRLSPADLDHILGGFQGEPAAYGPPDLGPGAPSPTLDGWPLLAPPTRAR